MSYRVSYLIDLEHKFSFMNVRYKGNSQAPIGYWPLEFSNLKNIKTAQHKFVIQGLNEVTSRTGALVSVPCSLLDMAVTLVVGSVLEGLRRIFFSESEGLKTTVVCLSNRVYANIGVVGLAMVRMVAGTRMPGIEHKMDVYITERMRSDRESVDRFWDRGEDGNYRFEQ